MFTSLILLASNNLKPSVSRSNIISNPSNEEEKQSAEFQQKQLSDMDIYYSTQTEGRLNDYFDEPTKNEPLQMKQTHINEPVPKPETNTSTDQA